MTPDANRANVLVVQGGEASDLGVPSGTQLTMVPEDRTIDLGRPATGASGQRHTVDFGRPGTGASVQGVDLGRPATGASVNSGYPGRPATGASAYSAANGRPGTGPGADGQPAHGVTFEAAPGGYPEAPQPAQYGPPPEPLMEHIRNVETHRQQKMSYYGHQQRNIYGVGVASLIQEHQPQPPPQPQQLDAQQQAEYQAQVAAYQQQQMQMMAANYYENEELKRMRPHMAAGDPYNQQFRPPRTRAQGQESWGVSSMFHGPFATG